MADSQTSIDRASNDPLWDTMDNYARAALAIACDCLERGSLKAMFRIIDDPELRSMRRAWAEIISRVVDRDRVAEHARARHSLVKFAAANKIQLGIWSTPTTHVGVYDWVAVAMECYELNGPAYDQVIVHGTSTDQALYRLAVRLSGATIYHGQTIDDCDHIEVPDLTAGE